MYTFIVLFIIVVIDMEMLPSTIETIEKYKPKIANIEKLLNDADAESNKKLRQIELILAELEKDEETFEKQGETEGKARLLAVKTDLLNAKKEIESWNLDESLSDDKEDSSPKKKKSRYKLLVAVLAAFMWWEGFKLFKRRDSNKGFFENLKDMIFASSDETQSSESRSAEVVDSSLSSDVASLWQVSQSEVPSEASIATSIPSPEQNSEQNSEQDFEQSPEQDSEQDIDDDLEQGGESTEDVDDEMIDEIDFDSMEREESSKVEDSSIHTPEQAKAEAKKLHSAWYSTLYILIKMSLFGFAPKASRWSKGHRVRSALKGWPLQALGRKRRDLMEQIFFLLKKDKQAIVDVTKQEFYVKDTSIKRVMDEHLNLYGEMEHDLKTGMTQENFIEKYGKKLETAEGKRLKIKKMTPEQLSNYVTETIDKKLTVFAENELKLNDLKATTKQKLKELDQDTKLHPKHQKDNQKKAQELLKKNSGIMHELQVQDLQAFDLFTPKQLEELQKKYPSLDNLVKHNGGNAEKCLEKISTSKAGKFAKWAGKFAIGSLVIKTIADYGTWVLDGDLSLKDVGFEVLDLGAGCFPLLWGLYDAVTAFTGSPITGADFDGKDKWIRAWIGVWTAVLDAFSFGMGGTAVRAAVKWGTKAAKAVKTASTTSKGAKTAKVAKGVNATYQFATFGYLWYVLYEDVFDVAMPVWNSVIKATTPDHKLTI